MQPEIIIIAIAALAYYMYTMKPKEAMGGAFQHKLGKTQEKLSNFNVDGLTYPLPPFQPPKIFDRL